VQKDVEDSKACFCVRSILAWLPKTHNRSSLEQVNLEHINMVKETEVNKVNLILRDQLNALFDPLHSKTPATKRMFVDVPSFFNSDSPNVHFLYPGEKGNGVLNVITNSIVDFVLVGQNSETLQRAISGPLVNFFVPKNSRASNVLEIPPSATPNQLKLHASRLKKNGKAVNQADLYDPDDEQEKSLESESDGGVQLGQVLGGE
jgi:hypothetical protein